jgi:signal transduction histidine kinase/ActR/RegA family two-component response regulator
MRAHLSIARFIAGVRTRHAGAARPATERWRALPVGARLYVAAVIAAGVVVVAAFAPRTLPHPLLFVALAVFACVTSAWKVTLPIPVTNGSTLSVSYAANVMTLLLLGPERAVIVAVLGVWVQCKYRPKRPYPLYRAIFSAAVAAITMAATSATYAALGGTAAPLEFSTLARPLVGAMTAYFVVNTGLVAAAIASSTGRGLVDTWRRDFLWSAASFMVAGAAGAFGAMVVHEGEGWKAVLIAAPIYLVYRSYELFAGRLEDQQRHTREIQGLHQETVRALGAARETEHLLAAEKERLAVALAEMSRLEELRNQLLDRERASRASAEAANRVKDHFLAIVSHELRTPLNAVLGWAEMLCKGKVAPHMRDRALTCIYNGARRQAQLIEDLLDVSRLTSGKLRLQHASVDLRETLRDALQLAQPAADAKRIRLTASADIRVAHVRGDGARLQQVASNLLSNAIKFTPEDGLVHVQLRRADDAAEVVVSDTGKGIAPEFLPWVFEPFRQADESTTRVHAGLGLGLAIVRSIVEAHGGRVSVQSAGEGQGATFTVRLPHQPGLESMEDPAGGWSPASEPAGIAPSIAGTSVLVVDDDEQTREVVAAHLLGCQASVLTAASAEQALDLLHRERVDVLLADIGMPDVDGYSLIRRLRASPIAAVAAIPAAALTAFVRDDDRQRALDAGFQLHLAKPVDERSLLSAVAGLASVRLTAASL